MRWNHLFNDKLFSNLTLTNSRYDFEFAAFKKFLFEEDESEDESEDEFNFFKIGSFNQEYNLKLDFDYHPAPLHYLRFGLGAAIRTFDANIDSFDEEDDEFEVDEVDEIKDFEDFVETQSTEANEIFAYGEYQYEFKNGLLFNAGLRTSTFYNQSTSYIKPEPRLSITYQLNKQLKTNFSANRLVQYLHLISSSSLQIPTDLWIPSDTIIAPQTAWVFEHTWAYQPNEHLVLSAKAYYKRLKNLYRISPAISTIELTTETLANQLIEGEGESKGVELLLEYHKERFGGISSYVLSKADRQFIEVNQNQSFPFEYDARHQFKLLLYLKMGNRFRLSTNWIYSSPSPQRYLQESDIVDTFVRPKFNENNVNAKRSSAYHRLDVELTYHHQTAKATHVFKIGAFNVYNQKNIAFYEIIGDEGDSFVDPILAIPFLPSLSYSLKI